LPALSVQPQKVVNQTKFGSPFAGIVIDEISMMTAFGLGICALKG